MKLYYFDVRNLAEPIRVLLHYKQVPFEDIRLQIDDWLNMKNDTPQGKLPVLEVEGKKLAQSSSIIRYLARVHNLTGRNNIERAVVDSISDLIKDLYGQIYPYYYYRMGVKDGNLDELKEGNLLPQVNTFFPIFVKYLKEANSGYYAKSGLTYVDFVVAEFFDILYAMDSSIFEPFPELLEHINRVHALPELKDYIDNRPPASNDLKN